MKSLDLDDDARERLGERVVVTRDGARMFLYTDSEETAGEAEKIVRELAVADELEAKMRITRWDPDADEWVDPGTPKPQSETERVEEHRAHEKREEREAAATGQVRVGAPRRPGAPFPRRVSWPNASMTRTSSTTAAGSTC